MKIFQKKKKTKGKKKVGDRYQILTEKTKAETTWVYEKTLFSTEKLLGYFKDPRAIKFVSWISPWNMKNLWIFLWVTTKKIFNLFFDCPRLPHFLLLRLSLSLIPCQF